MKRSKGTLSRATRKLGKRKPLSISPYFKEFAIGQRTIIEPLTNVKGYPHPRFRGKHGIVIGKRGNAYEVEVIDGRKKKILVVTPIHLKSAE